MFQTLCYTKLIKKREEPVMSEFKELIKSFPKTREYVRDFFVYGFKTRDDFKDKSGRTYDNERRRIESWLGSFVKQDYTSKGKNISLAIDSNLLDTNPLYRVWKTKSFTDNDIQLHFFLLDFLSTEEGYTIEQITDGLLADYDIFFDAQMIRRKCNVYVKEGILRKDKIGKDLLYYKNENFADVTDSNPELTNALKFYAQSTPLGIVGDTILDNIDKANDTFRIKHGFFVHTLEDEMLLLLLSAMQQKCNVTITVRGTRSHTESVLFGTPLQIFTSTQTGRRFLCLHLTEKKRFHCLRLDGIKNVNLCKPQSDKHPWNTISATGYDHLKQALKNNHPYIWGVSFQNGSKSRLEKVKLTIYVDEEREMFIVERLQREGRGGHITKIAPCTFTYEKEVFDSTEMLPWLRTFTGRIIDLECDNAFVRRQFVFDMQKMYELYDI